MNNNDDYDMHLYVMAELKYNANHSNEKDIFPIDWYSITDYKDKVEIISEALKKNIRIEETELYQTRYERGKFVL